MQNNKTIPYHINYQNKTIHGVLLTPPDNQKHPIVIICHGFNGTYQDNLNYACQFIKHHIASYSFDFYGGSLYSHSSKQTTNMSVMTQLQDLLMVIQEIQSLPFVDLSQIFLFGESQGGLVCALAAHILKDKIKGLILLYPAFNIPDNARSEYSDISKIPPQFGLWGIPLGKCYYEDIYQLDVFASIRDYKGPVILFHGSHDELVPVDYSKKALQIYNHATLKVIDYVGHGFYGPISEKVSQMMIQFINNCIKQ